MKTLTLILLIFCINMQGQVYHVSYKGDTTYRFYNAKDMNHVLLKEYSEYEKECYNVYAMDITTFYIRSCRSKINKA